MSEQRLPPRATGVLFPAIVVVPVVAVVVVALWIADPANRLLLLLLFPLALILGSRLIMYAVLRRREMGVVIDHRGVTWVATASTVPWLMIDDLQVTRVGRFGSALGLYGSVGLVDRRHAALHVINLKLVRATADDVLAAIKRHAPHLTE